MSDERQFGWLEAVAFFLVGCAVTFVGVRYWPVARSFPVSVAHQANQNQWHFQTDFKIPTSIAVNSPDKIEVLVIEIHKPKVIIEPYPVSIKNLSDRTYDVFYLMYAYDGQNRRVDETGDHVIIGAKETVLRQVNFPAVLVNGGRFVSFRFIADIDQ